MRGKMVVINTREQGSQRVAGGCSFTLGARDNIKSAWLREMFGRESRDSELCISRLLEVETVVTLSSRDFPVSLGSFDNNVSKTAFALCCEGALRNALV